MSLSQQLNEAMKEAMRAKDSLRLNTIRQIRTSVKNKEIDDRRELSDQEIIGVISTLVKQRKESTQLYREGDRPDLAEKEEQEMAVLQEFLPAQLGEEEIRSIIEEAIAETGAASMKDMGRVMKVVTGRTLGRADGRLVSDLVKVRLSA
ncbi:MAG TPA: GatB/YqeY domain-containing protein [Deferrimonas sp.]